ncbi:MAG: hypothetical protein ACLQGP_02870 [Isosphaeraceae bacterium]
MAANVPTWSAVPSPIVVAEPTSSNCVGAVQGLLSLLVSVLVAVFVSVAVVAGAPVTE